MKLEGYFNYKPHASFRLFNLIPILITGLDASPHFITVAYSSLVNLKYFICANKN